MVVMFTMTYPLSSAMKAVQVFLDVAAKEPLPDNVQLLGMYSHWGGDGIKVNSIYECKENIDDGIKALTKRLVNFFSVEGYKIESQVVLPIEESLAILGKEMPTA